MTTPNPVPMFQGKQVKYVDASGAIVDATIEDNPTHGVARVRYADDKVAISKYSEGKEPNTFHIEAEEAPKAKPFKPGGANAAPDKTTK